MKGVCAETRLRIRVAVCAYAYEVRDDPLVSDGEFDKLCLAVDLEAETDDPKMDRWFIKNFNPSSGVWVRSHPDIPGLERIYQLIKASCRKHEDLI